MKGGVKASRLKGSGVSQLQIVLTQFASMLLKSGMFLAPKPTGAFQPDPSWGVTMEEEEDHEQERHEEEDHEQELGEAEEREHEWCAFVEQQQADKAEQLTF